GDALLQFDWSVGQVLETLDRLGLTENTLIVLTSDNGPVVDDGYADRAVELLGEHRPWGPFRGGKYSIFEAGTRIPFLVSWPATIKKANTSDALVSQIDLFASMGKLIGQAIPAGVAPDSQEQLNTLLGKKQTGRTYIVEQAGTLSISDGEWKYIVPSNGQSHSKLTNTELGNNPEPQLYNLKKDIGEKINQAASHPKEVARLKRLLEAEKDK
ncbi:MAG: sulfatase-like hydrolase/transferase, partial [Tannerellaceae bacterium]